MPDNKEKKMTKFDFDVESLLTSQSINAPISAKERDILDAAEKIFSERGVTNSTTAEIAKQAKVTEKTLFRYFPRKTVLIQRVLFPIILKTILPYQLAQARKAIYTDTSSVEGFLRAILMQRIEAAKSHRSQMKIFVNEIINDEDLRNKAFEIANKHVFSDIKKIFIDFQKKKMIRDDIDLDLLVAFCFQTFLGQILQKIILPSEQHEINVEETLKLVISGITPK